MVKPSRALNESEERYQRREDDGRDEFTGHAAGCRGGAADCTCSPEYRENLAQIAEALMETTASNCPGWHPADCPSEIVVDLVNERDELKADKTALLASLKELNGLSSMMEGIENGAYDRAEAAIAKAES